MCKDLDIQFREFGLFVSDFCTSVSQTANTMLVSWLVFIFSTLST